MLFLMLFFAIAPQRIVSVAPGITEILFALGAGDRVVGVSDYCNYPEAAKSKRKVGGYMTPSLEAILALRPDQVFMINQRPDVAQKLRQSRIDVVELDVDSLSGIYNSIQTIAGKIGAPARGQSLIQSIQKQLHDSATAANSHKKPRVLFIVGHSPGTLSDLIAVGRGSYLNELMQLAGAENIFAGAPAPYPKVNMEEIIRRNPDVIIDMGNNEMVTNSQKEAVKQLWNKYPFLRAVQRQTVFPVSEDYFVTASPRVVQAVRHIRRMIEQ
jgi:iron complex transport system substrate-binding protein